jgi:hypothetical protein
MTRTLCAYYLTVRHMHEHLSRRHEQDVYILAFQHYATVSRRVDDGYMVTLADVYPPGEEFGPYPAERLAHGWRDNAGRWRA